MSVEWELIVDEIHQESGNWMKLTFTNNKVITMKVVEWVQLGKPSMGETLFVTLYTKR